MDENVQLACRFGCKEKFNSFYQCNDHEKLCWLKTPYGSVWQREYCTVQFPLLAYSSVLQHEGQCCLNTSRRHQPEVSIKPISKNTPPLFNNKNECEYAPICCCVYQPMHCVISVSNNDSNPGRKYFRCSKSNAVDRCRFFQWFKDANY